MRAPGAGIAATALAVAACVASPTPESTPQLIDLPTHVPGPNAGCAGAVPEVTVRLDPAEEPPAWLEYQGRRWEVLWPAGYRLVTDPLVIVDGRGVQVLANGERREIAMCATPDDDLIIFAGVP